MNEELEAEAWEADCQEDIERAMEEDIALQCGEIPDEVDTDGRVISDADPGL